MLFSFEDTAVNSNDIMVSAYPELIDGDNSNNELWGFCIRFENNSNERIRLTKRDLCITDKCGNSKTLPCFGFNGELPDLEPGEYFEFEDTAQTAGEAVIYGSCSAITTKGKELKIKLPVINLSSRNSYQNLLFS